MTIKDRPLDDDVLLEAARDYQELVATRGWKRLLDFLAEMADSRLSGIRSCMSSDPLVKSALSDKWRHTEEVIIAIQNEVLGTMEARDTYLKEILRNQPQEELERIFQGGNNGKSE